MLINEALRTCEIASRSKNVEILDTDFVARQLIAERIFTAKAHGYMTCSIAHSITDHPGVLMHCDTRGTFETPYTDFRDKYDEPVFYFVNPKNATELDLATFFNRVAKNCQGQRRPDCVAVIKMNDLV